MMRSRRRLMRMLRGAARGSDVCAYRGALLITVFFAVTRVYFRRAMLRHCRRVFERWLFSAGFKYDLMVCGVLRGAAAFFTPPRCAAAEFEAARHVCADCLRRLQRFAFACRGAFKEFRQRVSMASCFRAMRCFAAARRARFVLMIADGASARRVSISFGISRVCDGDEAYF